MITLHVDVPYASFRKSYARSFAETYPLPPPSTIYGMLLSLVGEVFRRRHAGVRLAFAYKCLSASDCSRNCMPNIATTLRKLSRFKYGVSSHSGHKPDYIETLCGIEFLTWVDSSAESKRAKDTTPNKSGDDRNLEERIVEAVTLPESVNRYGVLCLGLSDDAVNDISLCVTAKGAWHRLLPSDTGDIELPVLVQHVGAAGTRWQRYKWEVDAVNEPTPPDGNAWQWTEMDYPHSAQF